MLDTVKSGLQPGQKFYIYVPTYIISD